MDGEAPRRPGGPCPSLLGFAPTTRGRTEPAYPLAAFGTGTVAAKIEVNEIVPLPATS
jgi:hypothetical protein